MTLLLYHHDKFLPWKLTSKQYFYCSPTDRMLDSRSIAFDYFMNNDKSIVQEQIAIDFTHRMIVTNCDMVSSWGTRNFVLSIEIQSLKKKTENKNIFLNLPRIGRSFSLWYRSTMTGISTKGLIIQHHRKYVSIEIELTVWKFTTNTGDFLLTCR